MKHSLKNSILIMMILVSLIATGTSVASVDALGQIEQLTSLPLLPGGLTYGYLNDVWGVNADNIFAVGKGHTGGASLTKPIIYRGVDSGSGLIWSSSLLSLPEGYAGQLQAVWGVNENTVFAVGAGGVDNPTLPMVTTWNGSTWSAASFPGFPSGSGFTYGSLESVWGVSANNVVAVGNGGGGSITNVPMVYHWNGTTWTPYILGLPTTDWDYGFLTDVWVTTSPTTRMYAVGFGSISGSGVRPLLYYSTNGTSWSSITGSIPLPTGWDSGMLDSVWGLNASDIYLAGSADNGPTTVPLLYHWNGSNWTTSNPALATGWSLAELHGVWGASTDEVYAIGVGTYNGSTTPLMYRKTSSGWAASSAKPTGWVSGSFNGGLWGPGTNDVYAVGFGNNGSRDVPLFSHAAEDTTSPGAVTGLVATSGTTNGGVNLSWTAPADDGVNINSGPVDSYIIRYSQLNTLTGCNDPSGQLVTSGLPVPASPGSAQTMSVSGLTPGTLYYFYVCAQDDDALISNYVMVSATARETVIYDDMDAGWAYSGSFTIFSSSSAYNGKIHYTTTLGNYAQFTFTGSQISILYTGNTNRGKVDVFLDGNPTKIGTINQYTASAVFQKRWASGNLGTGTHTIKLVHAGPSGTMINIDAIEAGSYQSPSSGMYDDTEMGWTYTGAFTNFASPLAYSGGIRYTTTVGNYAEFTFIGSQVSILYTGNTNRGNVDVFLDGNPTKIATFNEYTASVAYQKRWTSGDLGTGTHTVKLVHSGPSGTTINIDAIEIDIYQPPPGNGTYDDDHDGWIYNGTFTTFASSSAYDGGIRYTTTVGDYAEFTFTGSQISILYTGNTNRGNVDVFLDGNPTKIGTINEYTSSAVFQKKWTSGDLGAGTHTVKLVHAGAAGKMINIDAIEVGTYTPPAPVGAGTYDDGHAGWTYTGAFTTFASSSAYDGGIRYTTTVGDYAEFTFTGSQIILVYTGNANRGNVDVFLDGSPTKLTTINEYTATAVFQQHSATITVGAGTHTIRLVHAGPAGTTINIDAIEIQ